MDRWRQLSGTGAHLLWRVKNAARSVPFRQLKVLKDRSELVLAARARPCCAPGAAKPAPVPPRLPDTVARLTCLTVLTRTRSRPPARATRSPASAAITAQPLNRENANALVEGR